ncbi:hypothetical protein B0H14DRAFT_2617601 [Mycena olivaceomarginata]|nr:hypothetical protein B0H14DRAFT_2617601 [Mycena olivaceomarginata]
MQHQYLPAHSPPNRTSARSLALFTRAPISEFVYLLTGVDIRALGNETYSLTGGDYGWELWQALTSRAVYGILDVPGFDGDSDDEEEEEEEYEEPEEGSGGKKRKPKPPRGAEKEENRCDEAVKVRGQQGANQASEGRECSTKTAEKGRAPSSKVVYSACTLR